MTTPHNETLSPRHFLSFLPYFSILDIFSGHSPLPLPSSPLIFLLSINILQNAFRIRDLSLHVPKRLLT